MMIKNCFCGMADRRKEVVNLMSSRDHCQRSSTLEYLTKGFPEVDFLFHDDDLEVKKLPKKLSQTGKYPFLKALLRSTIDYV